MSEEMKPCHWTFAITSSEGIREVVRLEKGSDEPVIAADATEHEIRTALKWAALRLRNHTRAPRPPEGAIDEGAVEIIQLDADGQRLGAELSAALSAAAIGTGGQWISVKERLPKEREDVLVVVDWQDNEPPASWCGFLCDGKWRMMGTTKFSGDDGDIAGNVTHWCPLPSPPSQRGGE